MEWTCRILDAFFVLFHSSLILFNLFGWLWRKVRRYNLILLLLTAASWSILGWILGVPGYCPFTDWHFRILKKLGETGLPNSYVKYLVDRITGLDFNPVWVDRITLFSLVAALLCSVFFNARDFIKVKKHPDSDPPGTLSML